MGSAAGCGAVESPFGIENQAALGTRAVRRSTLKAVEDGFRPSGIGSRRGRQFKDCSAARAQATLRAVAAAASGAIKISCGVKDETGVRVGSAGGAREAVENSFSRSDGEGARSEQYQSQRDNEVTDSDKSALL